MNARDLKPKIEKKLNSSKENLSLVPLSGRDHFTYKLYYKNRFIVAIQLSFGSSEFGKSLIGKMSRQLGISSQELIGIEKCTFWGKDFVEKSSLIKN